MSLVYPQGGAILHPLHATNSGWTGSSTVQSYWLNKALFNSAQDQWIEWAGIPLRARDYVVHLAGYARTNGGIVWVQLSTDGVSFATVGTIDLYAAANAAVVLRVVITVSADGVYTIRLVAGDKNPSSSGYLCYLSQLRISPFLDGTTDPSY